MFKVNIKVNICLLYFTLWYILTLPKQKHIFVDICFVEDIPVILILELWKTYIIYKQHGIYKACLLTTILIA